MKIKSRYRVSIDTYPRVQAFVKSIEQVKGHVVLVGNDGDTECRVNGRSIIGSMYAMIFRDLWCESDIDIYPYIKDFVINESESSK